MTLYFILTPFKFKFKCREGNTLLTYICLNLLQHVFTCSKSAKNCRIMSGTRTGHCYFHIENDALGPASE